ncbi:MAG: tetratricopeptide repeat protein [Elusimicrobiota bacterium]
MISPKTKYSLFGLLLLATILLYGHTIDNPFVWDDAFFYYDKESLYSNPGNLKILLGSQYFTATHERSYRPVVTLSYFVNFLIWGRNIYGHRLLNPALHLMVGWLIFLIVLQLTKSVQPAFITALLFIIHPVNSEAVLCISNNDNIIVALFVLLAFYLYLLEQNGKYATTKKLLSILGYTLALFSKETALIYLPLVFVYERIICSNNSVSKTCTRLAEYYLMPTMFYLLIRFGFMYVPYGTQYVGGGLWSNIASMMYIHLLYIQLLIAPVNLALFHKIPVFENLFDLRLISGMLVFLVLTVYAIWSLIKRKPIGFVLFVWGITLLPAMNIIPVINYPFGERYLYLTSIPFCFCLAWVVTKYCKSDNRILLGAAGVLVIWYSVLLEYRTDTWNVSDSFYTVSYNQSPWSGSAQHNMAVVCANRKEYDKAEQLFVQAINTKEQNEITYGSFSEFYKGLKKYETQQNVLIEGISRYPFNTYLREELALSFARGKKYGQALETVDTWLKQAPNDFRVLFVKGKILEEMGKYPEALNIYLSLSKNQYSRRVSGLFHRMAAVYTKMGDTEKALKTIYLAIEQNPMSANVHNDMGEILFQRKQYVAAAQEFKLALKYNPNLQMARESLVELSQKKYVK